MAREDVLVSRSQNGEGSARRPLPLSGKWLNSVILDVSHNRRFATPRGRAEQVRSARLFINSFRYCQGVIELDAEIPDRALDLGMPKQ